MTDETIARTSNTLSMEQQLVAGIRTAMAYLEGNPPMVSAALERLQEASDAYANTPETGACRAPTKAHISEMTVRRLDAGYVVTWREDGESCGSETISEKLAYTLVRNSEGISGINDETTDLKANQQANTPRPAVPSDALGIAWWNGCSDGERAFWLKEANSAVPADAWQACQTSDKTYDGQQSEGMR